MYGERERERQRASPRQEIEEWHLTIDTFTKVHAWKKEATAH
jgi:hypothetical protein